MALLTLHQKYYINYSTGLQTSVFLYMKTCTADNCNNPVFAKGFCKFHQWKRTDLKKPKSLVKKERPNKALDEAYYQLAIVLNRKKNGGMCKCDECRNTILSPIGRNVNHLISKG